jgi:hypothetical protein
MKYPPEIENYSHSFAPASFIEVVVRDCAEEAKRAVAYWQHGDAASMAILARYGLEPKK